MKYVAKTFAFIIVAVIATVGASADIKYTDHPLLSGLPAYKIAEKSDDYDAVAIEADELAGKIPDATLPLRFEGHITRLEYEEKNKSAHSNYGIYKSYEVAISKLGGRQLNEGFEKTSEGIINKYNVFEIPANKKAPKYTILLKTRYPREYYLYIIEHTEIVDKVKTGGLLKEIETQGFATVHVNFDDNKSDLKNDATDVILQITELLKENPKLALSIEGHTDNVGSAESNKKLSLDRAESVKKAVVSNGIAASRLSTKGFGAESPVADNRSEAGKAQNRRVELIKVK